MSSPSILLTSAGRRTSLLQAFLEAAHRRGWRVLGGDCDPSRRQQMGTEGRRHIAEQFDSRLVLQRLCNFYSRIELELATRPHKA